MYPHGKLSFFIFLKGVIVLLILPLLLKRSPPYKPPAAMSSSNDKNQGTSWFHSDLLLVEGNFSRFIVLVVALLLLLGLAF
jgi:hypothetical protein